MQNLLVADRQGIGLFVTGRVPLRRAGDGSRPVPGADGSHDWIGFATGEALPHVVDPASGRLVNANERVAPADFPPFLGRDWFGDCPRAAHPRAARHGGRFTAGGFRRHADRPVDPGRARPAAAAARRAGAPRLPAAAVALLARLGRRHGDDLPQPLIFNAWMQRLYRDILARAGVPPAARRRRRLDLAGPSALRRRAGCCAAAIARPCCRRRWSRRSHDLAARFGPDPAAWRWGAAHQAVFAHPVLGALPLMRRACGGAYRGARR